MRFSLSGFSIPVLTPHILSLRGRAATATLADGGPGAPARLKGETPVAPSYNSSPSVGTTWKPRSPPERLRPPGDAASDPTRSKHPSWRDRMRCESGWLRALARLVLSGCRPVPPPAQFRKPCRTKTLHLPGAEPPL